MSGLCVDFANNTDALMQKYVQIEAGLDQLRDVRDQDAVSLLLEMSQELEEGGFASPGNTDPRITAAD